MIKTRGQLTILKRVAYVTLGIMVTLVFALNQHVIDFIFPPLLDLTSAPAAELGGGPPVASTPHRDIVNWFTTPIGLILLPFLHKLFNLGYRWLEKKLGLEHVNE